MAMSPNCVDTEQIPSKMVAGDREILGIGENPKSFGESRSISFLRIFGFTALAIDEMTDVAEPIATMTITKEKKSIRDPL